ncbi:MAG: hypothetical protein J5808_05205 [Paludibacteraceae bacterium]|nr:hypothetical protein [Paludibacteraceae bacterium]
MKKLFITVVSTLLLCSCAIQLPNSNFSVSDQHYSPNTKIVGEVSGRAKTPYVLYMFGGFSKNPLLNQARTNALKNTHLKRGQSLAFESIQDELKVYPFVAFRTITFHAYIVEDANNNMNIAGTEIQNTTQGLEPTYVPSEPQQESSNEPIEYVAPNGNADLCYLAYLRKQGQLDNNLVVISIPAEDIAEIKKLSSKHSLQELKTLSDGYNRKLEAYKKK